MKFAETLLSCEKVPGTEFLWSSEKLAVSQPFCGRMFVSILTRI